MKTCRARVVRNRARRKEVRRGGEVVFLIDHLENIVDQRLERAANYVASAVAFEGERRTEAFGSARADYSAAHAIAALVDFQIYDANEWPVFSTWAAELMAAAVQ